MRRVLIPAVLCILMAGLQAEEGPSTPSGEPKTPLDETFRGQVKLLRDGQVEIKYDFSDPEQMKDWVSDKPFRVKGELKVVHEGQAVRLKGVGALRHRAAFRDKVALEGDFTPTRDRDLGIVVAENAEGNQFVIFAVNDIYFQRFDGGIEPAHMICRFGIRDATVVSSDMSAFRYVARGSKPEIRPHQGFRIRAAKDGKDDSFDIGEESYQGKEGGRPISELHIGFYLVKSGANIDNVVVRGVLSPTWLKKENVELTLRVPPEEEGPSEEDKQALAKLDRYVAGMVGYDVVFTIIEDLQVSEKVRGKAAETLAASGDVSVVPRIVTLLYSDDLLTRRLALDVVKALAGKTFGIDPKADGEKRRTAIQKLIKYIQKNPKKFGS